MAARVGEAVARRPGRALAAGLAALVAALALALGAPERLAVGPVQAEGGPAPPELVVRVVPTPRAPAGSRVQRVAFDVIAARFEASADVESVEREAGKRESELTVAFAPGLTANERAAEARRLLAAADPGPVRVVATGAIPELRSRADAVGAELPALALAALPFFALVAWALLGARLALAALAAAALGALGCAAALRLLDPLLHPSLLALAAGAPVGAAVALELTALARARTEAASALGAGEESPALGLAETAAAAPWPCAAAALAPLALLVTPLEQAPAIALGCGLASLIAAAGVLLFAPAALGGLAGAGEPAPAHAGAPASPARRLVPHALPWAGAALVLGAVAALALAALARPPANWLGGLAPATGGEAAALAAALGGSLALLASRSALDLAVARQEGVASAPAALVLRGHLLATACLAALGAVFAVSGLAVDDVETETRLLGGVLGAAALADLVLARLPLALAGRAGRDS